MSFFTNICTGLTNVVISRRRSAFFKDLQKILYTSSWDVTKKIMKHEGGITALYKGGLTNMIRASGGALVLVVYDVLKDYLKK